MDLTNEQWTVLEPLIGELPRRGVAVSSSVIQGGMPLDGSPLHVTNEFYIKPLSFNLWVHHGDSMQVGKRNPLGTVTFTGIDFAAYRQTRVVALL
jgi:hypothetical protein